MKNNKEIENEQSDTVAAMGIGAMIVFIALILVAAVASAVIIQTAEKLQQNAQATGEGTKDAMASKLVIISAIVTNAAGNTITLTLELAPGSDPVADADVFWIGACEGGPDSGTVTSANLDGGGAGFERGEVYTAAFALPNCFGLETQFGLQAGGAGFTYEVLSGWTAAPANGDVII